MSVFLTFKIYVIDQTILHNSGTRNLSISSQQESSRNHIESQMPKSTETLYLQWKTIVKHPAQALAKQVEGMKTTLSEVKNADPVPGTWQSW